MLSTTEQSLTWIASAGGAHHPTVSAVKLIMATLLVPALVVVGLALAVAAILLLQ